jgi:hypothetical protein
MKKKLLLLATLLLATAGFIRAENPVQLLPYKKSEFSPALSEHFVLPLRLTREGNVTIEILGPDSQVLRRIDAGVLSPGLHSVQWDGKDRWGDVVPDEAYLPRIIFRDGNRSYRLDFRNTGGEVLQNLDRHLDRFGRIRYHLSRPARTLVRIGVENGPLLKVLSNWVPRAAGEIRQRWNFIGSGGVDMHDAPFVAAISAFALPEHSIITTNNRKEDYLSYFKRHGFICTPPAQLTPEMLHRNGKKISPHFYACRIDERDPKITMRLGDNPRHAPAILSNNRPINVHVSMSRDDAALMDGKQYEVSFYLDYRFLSEAEQGYLPLSWRFLPNNIKPGRHILTVNLSAFDGKVATRSLTFTLQNSSPDR